MTTPNGEGVNTSDESWNALAWMVSGPDQPNTTALSTLADRDQDAVTAAHTAEMQSSPGWNTSSADICDILTGNPIVGGLFGMGTATTPTGKMVSGGQYAADTICGFLTGNPDAAGTSPQTLLTGAGAMSDQVADNAFAQGVLDMGGGADETTGLAGGFCAGGMSFLGMLCGIGTGSTDVSQTTPQTVVDSVQANASTAHLLMAGVPKADATGPDLTTAADDAIKRNNSALLGGQALTTATSVSLKEQNLLISQDFTNAYVVVTSPHWAWDGTDGDGKLGCIKVTCDGTQDPYVSNEIPVIFNENIEVAARVKWSDLGYTGNSPIVLGVQKYRKAKGPNGGTVYIDVGHYEVDRIEAAGSDSDWADLAGTYTVQSRVDQLRFLLKVESNATDGVVKWDNLVFLKLDLIADGAVPGLGNNIDNIVTKLYGVEGEGFSRNDSAVTLANTAAVLTSVAARVSALEAEGHTGAIGGDDFSWTGEILASANWGGHYLDPTMIHGHWEADGADAFFYGEGFSPFIATQMGFFDWQGSDEYSDDDYQLIQVLLSSAPMTSQGYWASNRVFGRIKGDWSSYIMAEFFSYGGWQLVSHANGTDTVMASGTCEVPGLGRTISLYCGDKETLTPRKFKLMVGTTVIKDWFTEDGTASVYGSDNRKYGWGGCATGGLYFAWITFLPTQGVPGKVNQWIGLDQ